MGCSGALRPKRCKWGKFRTCVFVIRILVAAASACSGHLGNRGGRRLENPSSAERIVHTTHHLQHGVCHTYAGMFAMFRHVV